MKISTKKAVSIVTISVLLLSGIATGAGYLLYGSNNSNETSTEKKGKLTEAEQQEFVQRIEDMRNSGERPTEIEKELQANIDRLDKEHSTKAVREFMKSIEDTSSYFYQLLYVMGPELEYTKSVDNVKNPVEDIDKISNEFAKGYIQEMKRQFMYVFSGDGYYYLEPDATYVLDNYGKYLHGDYKDYINLSAKQQTEPIFDSVNSRYNLDRVRDDLVYIDNSRDRWSGGDYEEDFKQMERELYEVMFGVSHGTFYDLNVENNGEENEEWTYTLKDEIRKKYEDIVKEDNDMPFAKDLKEFLDVLKEHDYQYNEEIDSFLADMFAEKFGLGSEEQTEDSSEEVSSENKDTSVEESTNE